MKAGNRCFLLYKAVVSVHRALDNKMPLVVRRCFLPSSQADSSVQNGTLTFVDEKLPVLNGRSDHEREVDMPSQEYIKPSKYIRRESQPETKVGVCEMHIWQSKLRPGRLFRL